MERVLLVPAAGPGSRLHAPQPKVLSLVDGRPMIDHLFQMYAPFVRRFVLVVHPDTRTRVAEHCDRLLFRVEYHEQPSATGMLDALLVPIKSIRTLAPDRVWVTWCDQIAVHPRTIERLAGISSTNRDAALVLPTGRCDRPYIHFVRDELDCIVDVRQRREDDAMPGRGESDIGVFDLSLRAYCDLLPAYSDEAPVGARTGERNFLPFIPWLAQRAPVHTFPSRDAEEAIGVNTQEDRNLVERYLRRREEADRGR